MEVMLGIALAISLIIISVMYVKIRLLTMEISRIKSRTEFSDEEARKLLRSIDELKRLKRLNAFR
ncbi:MAG: hypothetical protein OD815_000717 [Candidatus Alkanophagales archaeon MCA70_species_2]|nr:hypothetical protein [Candidatus Alkanophaga liquidiphilum]RLG36921.1 MAG: hypothetical protein DRN91_06760 [Candidatus Alkanophagales archaeon]